MGTVAEQLGQMGLRAPQGRRAQARWRGDVAADQLEELADEPVGRPVGQPDPAARPADPGELGRLLTSWVPQSRIRNLSVRFVGITHLGHVPTCTGTVVEKFEADGEKRVRIKLLCANQYGEPRLTGEAVVALA